MSFFKKKEPVIEKTISEREAEAKLKNPLTKLIIAPVDVRISIDSDFTRIVAKTLDSRGGPMKINELITVRMLGQVILFKVVEAIPDEGWFTTSTDFEIMPEPKEGAKHTIMKLEVLELMPGGELTLGKGDSIIHQEVVWDGQNKDTSKLVCWILRYYDYMPK